ncbi:unnamed protein product, partial [Prorocentrum cordatum]
QFWPREAKSRPSGGAGPPPPSLRPPRRRALAGHGARVPPRAPAASAAATDRREDSDETCKAGDPGCGEKPADEEGDHDSYAKECPPLSEEQSATLNECTEGKKQWKWGLDRLQSSDKEGATNFVIKAYNLCLKKMGLERAERCVRAWVDDTIEYKWLKQGLGVSPECKAEAHSKYNTGSKEVEDCAQTYNDRLQGFDEPEEQAMIYSDILENCAGVSPLCARQNGYMMAERAQQQSLKELGIDTKGGTVRR